MTMFLAVGLWDQRAFVGHLAAGDYPLVLLAGEAGQGRADVLTPEMVAAIQAGYVLRFRDVYYTYAPRNGP